VRGFSETFFVALGIRLDFLYFIYNTYIHGYVACIAFYNQMALSALKYAFNFLA
jgi:hypothetical protein